MAKPSAALRKLLDDCRTALWQERHALAMRSEHPPRWDQLTRLLKRLDRALAAQKETP